MSNSDFVAMSDYSSEISEITTEDELESLKMLVDTNVCPSETNQREDNLLKSTFLDYFDDPDLMVASGHFLPSYSKKKTMDAWI